jgi:hypothetical protein
VISEIDVVYLDTALRPLATTIQDLPFVRRGAGGAAR